MPIPHKRTDTICECSQMQAELAHEGWFWKEGLPEGWIFKKTVSKITFLTPTFLRCNNIQQVHQLSNIDKFIKLCFQALEQMGLSEEPIEKIADFNANFKQFKTATSVKKPEMSSELQKTLKTEIPEPINSFKGIF